MGWVVQGVEGTLPLMCFVPGAQIWTSVTSPQSPATSSARTPRAATSAPAPGATSCRRTGRSAKVRSQEKEQGAAGGEGTGQPDMEKYQQVDVGKGATLGWCMRASSCHTPDVPHQGESAPGPFLESAQNIPSSRELRPGCPLHVGCAWHCRQPGWGWAHLCQAGAPQCEEPGLGIWESLGFVNCRRGRETSLHLPDVSVWDTEVGRGLFFSCENFGGAAPGLVLCIPRITEVSQPQAMGTPQWDKLRPFPCPFRLGRVFHQAAQLPVPLCQHHWGLQLQVPPWLHPAPLVLHR